MSAGITFHEVTKRFGPELVLDRYSAEFPFVETTCLMGRSGAGKTTIFRLLLGLIRPDSGTIAGIGGVRIVAVFQENRLLRGMSAVDNVLLVTDGRAEAARRSWSLLARMGLDRELARKRVDALSGGQQRRVAIARALAAEADVVLMDEPLKGLDEATARTVCGVISDETRERTLIFSTHDRREAERLCARVVEI